MAARTGPAAPRVRPHRGRRTPPVPQPAGAPVHRRRLGRGPAATGRPRQHHGRAVPALCAGRGRSPAHGCTPGRRAFAQPAHRSAWTPELAALDASPSAPGWPSEAWTTPTCAGTWTTAAATTTAPGWMSFRPGPASTTSPAGTASHAPGDDRPTNATRVFTWPEGNAWLTAAPGRAAAGPPAHRPHGAARAGSSARQAQVLAWDEAAPAHRVRGPLAAVVLALPLFIAARVLEDPPDALRQAVPLLHYAPWLVANLHLDAPLLDRPGAPPSLGQRGLRPAGPGLCGRLAPEPAPLRRAPRC
jgi:hypothetical protein